MKQILFFVALVFISFSADGQNAALTIDNHSDVCTAYVNVKASDATLGNGNACDIQTCTIVVPPLTTFAWTDPVDVYTGTSHPAGICGMATSFGVAALTTALGSGTWIWTDATIQYICPGTPACTEGGCLLSANVCFTAPTPCYIALGGGAITWNSTVCNPPLVRADWLPSGSTCFMTDVIIDIW